MNSESRNTFISINLSNLEHNFEFIKSRCKNKKIAAVVKANAYGHGILEVSSALEKLGADYLCVAIADEGVLLRENGIKTPILVLGALNESGYRKAVNNELDITIGSLHELNTLLKIENIFEKKVNLHLLIDTGMHRDGFYDIEDFTSALSLLEKNTFFKIKGIYTHFAQADSDDLSFVDFQLENFQKYYEYLKSYSDLLIHCSASAGIVNSLDLESFNMVRPGLLLYGYSPIRNLELGLKKLMSVNAEIIAKRVVKHGESVGYSRTYFAEMEIRVATIAIGYGDGLPRKLSNKGKVIINNHICDIIGNVCMDQVMVNISDAGEVNIGDNCIILGRSEEFSIDANDIAAVADTISYEILCSFNERVRKIYEF